jgi:hypothetical protein
MISAVAIFFARKHYSLLMNYTSVGGRPQMTAVDRFLVDRKFRSTVFCRPINSVDRFLPTENSGRPFFADRSIRSTVFDRPEFSVDRFFADRSIRATVS